MFSLWIAACVLAQAPQEAPPAQPTPYPPAPPPAAPTPYTATGDQPSESPLAGFVSGEGFRLKDASGDYMLRVGLQAAYAFDPTWTGGEGQERSGIPFMRPILRGNIFKPWITFWTSMELAGNPPYLLDAYFDVVPVEAFGLRAGQQYSPYDRQEQLGPQQLFFPEWSPVADYFWPGRDKGVQVYGFLLDKRFEYYAGLFSGTPLRQIQTIPGNWELQGRLAFNPMGPVNGNEFPFTDKGEPLPTRISFSLESYGGKVESAIENFNDTTGQLVTQRSGHLQKYYDFGADAFFQTGPLIVSADGHYRNVNFLDGSPNASEVGAWAQAIVALWSNKLGAGVQVDWLDPNTSIASDSAFLAEAQVCWFIHAPELVLKLRYAYIHQQAPAASLGDVPLPYTPGDTNLFTLQFNLSF
jgi:hypothetical protein